MDLGVQETSRPCFLLVFDALLLLALLSLSLSLSRPCSTGEFFICSFRLRLTVNFFSRVPGICFVVVIVPVISTAQQIFAFLDRLNLNWVNEVFFLFDDLMILRFVLMLILLSC